MPNGDLDESWTTNGGYGTIIPQGDYYYLTMNGFPIRYDRVTGAGDADYFPISANTTDPYMLILNGGDIYPQADGKVLCTGDHHLFDQWGQNTPGWYSLLRVNSTDAKLDSTFDFRQTDGVIWTLVPTTQGRFLVSGVYSTYEGQAAGRILRIWPDGSLDTTFHTDIIKGYAGRLVELPDGRILAGGQFVFPNEPDTMHLIRLLPNGTLDPTFNNHTVYKYVPQSSFADFGFGVKAILPLPNNGTMMVGGSFTHINGQLRRGVALLDSAGNLLNTAFTGGGCGLWHNTNSTSMYSGLTDISLAPDGSIYVGGFFKGFDDGLVSDTSITFIAKLHGLSVGISETQIQTQALQVWPNPGNGRIQLQWPGQGVVALAVVDALGRTVHREEALRTPFELDLSHLSDGLYNLLVTTPDGERASAKWMKQ